MSVDEDIPENEQCHDGDDEPHRHCSCFYDSADAIQCCYCGEDPE